LLKSKDCSAQERQQQSVTHSNDWIVLLELGEKLKERLIMIEIVSECSDSLVWAESISYIEIEEPGLTDV